MKLESKELRIGNLINIPKYIDFDYEKRPKICEVNMIDLKNNVHYYWGGTGENYYYSIDECEPITLTEEWLLMFGFTKHGKYSYFYKDDLIIDKNDLGVFFMCDIDIHVEIKSVHHLQNLYWCLFGKELTLKP